MDLGRSRARTVPESKQLLTSPRLLVHFNQSKDLVLSCDATQYSIGDVFAHHSEEGTEQPISYTSRTPSPAEEKYLQESQLDKEVLAIIFGFTKSHLHLFGREFTIMTDHKPLTHLFHPNHLYHRWFLHYYNNGL